jgi:hypothetical protein
VAVALSLILHAALLFGWLPKVPMLPFEDLKEGRPSGSLAVHLAPPPPSRPPSAASVPVMQAPPTPARRMPPSAAPPSAPRMLSTERPSPAAALPPPVEATPPPAEDLASYIAAHRRAQPASAPSPPSLPPQPEESEQERHNRAVAASLGLNQTPSFGSEKRRGGGMFQIERVGYNDGEFFFYGWNKDIRRNSQQMIEVSRGNNPNMQIAIVRKMIAIIREHVDGDFVWESERLHRDVTLSARASDTAGLEDFLMQEFFSDRRR